MKKHVLSLLLSGLAITAQAQITLNQGNSSPVAGMSYKIYYGDSSVNPGPGGSNQHWDISNFVATDSGMQRYVPCLSTPWCGTFNGPTIAGTDGSGVYTYLEPTSTALLLHGTVDSSAAQVTSYNDPQELIRYPFTYGDAYVDSFRNSQTSGGVTYMQIGTDSVSADAYGSMALPTGSFNFTLRVKTISNIVDSAVIGGMPTYVGTERVESYTWYAMNKAPIFMTGTRSFNIAGSPAPLVIGYSSYTSQAATSVENREKLKASLSVFPNPAWENVQVQFTLTEHTVVSVSLTDMHGRNVLHVPASSYTAGTHSLKLPCAQLARGVYFLSVRGEGIVAGKKVELR